MNTKHGIILQYSLAIIYLFNGLHNHYLLMLIKYIIYYDYIFNDVRFFLEFDISS